MANAGKYVMNALTAVAQFVAAYVLGFALLIGESWLLTAVIPVYTPEKPGGGPVSTALQTGAIGLGATLGTWLIGWLVARLRGMGYARRTIFVNTLIGALIGVVAIWVTPATGMAQFLYPVVGAVAGYWLIPLARRLPGE